MSFSGMVIDRNRALQHFGSEGVMDSLLQRFPETVRGTLCRLKDAWLEGREEDFRCHIYQAHSCMYCTRMQPRERVHCSSAA